MPLVPGNQMLHDYAAVLEVTDAGAGFTTRWVA